MINFNVNKDLFKKAIKNHLTYVSFGTNSIYNSIRFEVKNNILSLISTNGNKLLVTEIEIFVNEGQNLSGNYDGNIFKSLKIQKSSKKIDKEIDELNIILDTDNAIINDNSNKFRYEIPSIIGNFPNYKQLLPKIDDKYQTVGLNIQYLKDLKNMIVKESTNQVQISFQKENSLGSILIESQTENVNQKSLIMPIDLKE